MEILKQKIQGILRDFSIYDLIIVAIMVVSAFHYYQVLLLVDQLAAVSIAVFIDAVHFSTIKALLRERNGWWGFVLFIFTLAWTGISFFFQFSFYNSRAGHHALHERIIFASIVPFGIACISVLKYLHSKRKQEQKLIEQTEQGTGYQRPARLPGESRKEFKDRLFLWGIEMETKNGKESKKEIEMEKGNRNSGQNEKENGMEMEMETNPKGNGNGNQIEKESNPEEDKKRKKKKNTKKEHLESFRKGICPYCKKDFSNKPDPEKSAINHFNRAHGGES